MGLSRTEARRADVGSVQIATQAPTACALAGICEMGPIGNCNAAAGTPEENQPLTSWAEFQRVYGGYTANARDLPLAAKSFFDEGGQLLYVSRVVRCTTAGDPTTRTSSAGTLTLLTASQTASAAFAEGTAAATYALVPAQQLDILIDANSVVNAVFNAAVASRDSDTGTFALSNNDTLTGTAVSVFGSVAFTITFTTSQFASIGAATAVEVAAAMNAYFSANNTGLTAVVVSNTVRIKTTLFGLAATLNITGGTANAVLAYTTGATTGTGNVQNIAAVTQAELKSVVEAATSSSCTVTSPGNVPTITSNTTGTSSHVQVQSSSTATAFGFDNALHTGGAAGTANTITFDGRWDGAYANEFTVQAIAPISGDSTRFDLFFYRSGSTSPVESWRDCSMDPTDPSYVVKLVNQGGAGQRASRYLVATDEFAPYPSPGNLPALGTFGPLTGGGDGLVSLADADFTGSTSPNGGTGLRVFNTIARLDLAGLPGRNTAAAQAGLVTWAEVDREGRTFVVLTAAAGLTAAAVRTHVASTAGLKGLSEIAVFAWPRIHIDNPSTAIFGTAATIVVDPVGHILGLYALTDRAKTGGAFEHPSNALGRFKSGRGVETNEVEDPVKRGLCQDDRIITIRSAGGLTYLDGARTLKATGPFPSVGESRGVMLVQNQIIAAFDDLRNANIRTSLYESLTNAATVYLSELTNAGCFRSRVYAEAFKVDFSEAINTPAVVEASQVLGTIGLNTSPPAEVISVTIVPYRGLVQQFAQAA